MSQKHTPGPWSIRKPKLPDLRQVEDRLICADVDDGNRLHVAEVYQYQNDNNNEADGTALANAALIAAAPDMLEALREIRDIFNNEYDNIEEVDECNTILGFTRPVTTLERFGFIANNAINKAEATDD